MSLSNYSLNQRLNYILTLLQGLTPPPVGGYVTINGSQTIGTGTKTFTILPECSVVPTTNNQLVNKLYVDGLTPSSTLQDVCDNGNGISNFVVGSTASITSTNFTNNRQLLLNANANPTIKMIDNLNSAHYTTFDIDTLNLNGTSTNWSTIVAGSATPTLSQVLTAGNNAGTTSINMNNNNISSVAGLYGQVVQLTNTTANTTLNVGSSSATTTTLLTKFNNGRTAQTGEAIRLDFNAKNSAGTEFNYGKIHMNTPAVGVGVERGRLDIDVKDSAGLTTYLSANGNAGSLQMTAPFLDMVSHPILAVTTITDNQSLPFIPQVDIEAMNSNVPVPIPAYNNRHQVLLRASPVPNISRFEIQPPTISGSVNCSCVGVTPSGVVQWLGTTTGDVYIYDTGMGNWTLVASFTAGGGTGSINALFYNSGQDRLYIGGLFDTCSGNTFNNVCYIQNPNTSPAIPNVLLLSGDNGFNAQCNAITGEPTADFVYFGGGFTQSFSSSLNLNYFGIYEQSTATMTPTNGNSGDGFDYWVNNLDFVSGGYVCATGFFTTFTSGGGANTSPYCIIFAISGNAVSSVSLFDGGLGSLSSGISGYNLISNNGAYFYVGINQIYTNGSYTINYLVELDLTGNPTPVGANAFNQIVTSFFYNAPSGYVDAVTTAGGSCDYYQAGTLYATLPSSNNYFVFRFENTGQTYFNLQGVGTQWAFTGSIANTFTLSSSRTIIYVGNTYIGGVNVSNPQLGYNLLLNWNGSYYIVVGTPQSSGAWSYF